MDRDSTIRYYDTHAPAFIQDTLLAGMDEIRSAFLAYLPSSGTILDLGCGSGRDSRAFLQAGYRVVSVDGSGEMCRQTERLTGQKAVHCRFEDFRPAAEFEGIWACASLLHLRKPDLEVVLGRLIPALVPGGCFYMSFKYGSFEGMRGERYFTDLTEESLAELCLGIPACRLLRVFQTADVRPGREKETWLNAFCGRVLGGEEE